MSGLDPLGGQHAAMASGNPYPPSPSSMRSPHSSHGHTSSSTKYMQSSGSGTNANVASYTSPRLHHSQAAAFGISDASGGGERYSFDNQRQQQHHSSTQQQQDQSHASSTYRNEGLGRSLSMGHGSHPSQSRSAAQAAGSGSAMYLSPQSGAAQAIGSHSSSGHGSNGSSGTYLSSLSPSGMRHSSFISGGSGSGGSGLPATSPQGSSYSGLPNLSSGSSHPASLLPAPQMLSSPYSNHSSRRSSNAMDTSGSSIRDAASGNPYSPNTSHSSRFGNSNAATGASGSRSVSHDATTSWTSARPVKRLGLHIRWTSNLATLSSNCRSSTPARFLVSAIFLTACHTPINLVTRSKALRANICRRVAAEMEVMAPRRRELAVCGPLPTSAQVVGA